MTTEEIINRLDYLMRREHAKNALLPDGFPLENEVLENEKALNAAIALLKTHPDAQPNEPLTMDELREMHGNPVWIYRLEDKRGWWAVVRINDTRLYTDYGAWCDLREYGKTWLAHRLPPKEDAR